MSDYRRSGVHEVNAWLWTLLQAWEYKAGVKAFGAYAPTGSLALVPIIPSQQRPEFSNIVGGAPFIIYRYTTGRSNDLTTRTERITYTIYDNDEERLVAIQNYMEDLLGRLDWSAADINSVAVNIDVKWTKVVFSLSPDDAKSEDGRRAATMSVICVYTVDQNQNGTLA